MKNLNRFYPHFLAIIGFVIVSLVYFYPVLQKKQIYQSDIVQYTGMAREQNDFRQQTGDEPYWANNAFGGMPTYQLGAKYPHNYIKQLDSVLRFLPRPADYVFIYFLGFYILLCALRIDPLKAFFGALAFGLSTYLIIILGVGHNAKAHAIAYMPMVVAGVLLVFRRRYVIGGLLTMLATALEINANHFQMTYYLLLLLLVIGIWFTVKFIKNKEYKHLFASIVILLFGAILSVGANASNLMATAEYTKFSIRSKSDLTIKPDGSTDTNTAAMDYDYITEYSYGVTESLDLIVPRMFGGGNREDVGENSVMYDFLLAQGASAADAKNFAANVPTYWGDQPIVEAPAYIGAIVFFLAVLALFIDRRKVKYAFLIGAIVSLLLSWGKNFPVLTNFFIDFVPLYDKFRAVSSIQVILELCMPVLAFMGLQSFFTTDKKDQWQALWKSASVCLGLLALIFVFKGSFDFAGMNDQMYMQMYGQLGPAFVEALQEQRMEMYTADVLRSFLFIAFATGCLYAAYKEKLSATVTVVLIGSALVIDLFAFDKNYVNTADFVSARTMEQPFTASQADNYILQDTSYYRVYDVGGRLNGRASYFYNSVGGYSAVRPQKMDELFTYRVEPELQGLISTIDQQNMALGKSLPVLDMLNIKYMLLQAGGDQTVPIANPHANGAAWFVKNVEKVTTANQEIEALKTLDTKNTALVNTAANKGISLSADYAADSTATIQLLTHKPNYLKYRSENKGKRLAVFSEVYYPKGWQAYIDGKPATHFVADYTLRAMEVPAGTHTIEFKFDPQVIKTGGTISLISCILMLLLIAGGLYYYFRIQKAPQAA
ncbi:YfhO family protein [Flavobacterium rhizosphaerae]|uniref:YfhO family protein n=1 Tax=Flavobacterium rhizosphaerae TaxID=3163298 RepID=A0ABW8YSQ9_9FLAO